MTHIRRNQGVCSTTTEVTLNDDGIIESVQVMGGCNGNLQGIGRLLVGMPAEEAIRRMEGVRCGNKATSCPDQIAACLREALDEM